MKVFVITIGTLCLISGLIELIVPSAMRNIVKKVLPKIDSRIIGFLSLSVGILLFYTSETIRLVLVVKIIGLLTVLKGLVIIFGPADKYHEVWKMDT